MKEYLKCTDVVDWKHPEVLSKAQNLTKGIDSPRNMAKVCFEWVRDEIKHIDDYDISTVTCKASEVLEAKSGICYAKSHLLAALLRAASISAGFCYQRLSRDDKGSTFCLHGLNAVYLPDLGWYRIDPRGNKEGINAQFTPPNEQLAFKPALEGEADFPEILSDPMQVVLEALGKYKTKNELWPNLPDVQIITIT